MPEFV
jgi:hypothetical protein